MIQIRGQHNLIIALWRSKYVFSFARVFVCVYVYVCVCDESLIIITPYL